MPPEVSIAQPQGPFYRGQAITFEATVANEALAKLLWAKSKGSCGAAPEAVPTEDAVAGATFSFAPAADELGDLCIRVQATDTDGATNTAQAQITVLDRLAVVTLLQLQPGPGEKARLGSEVVVSATASDPDPGDDPLFTLGLQTPEGKSVPFGVCENTARPAHEHCFVVTAPGPWVVAVQGKDTDTTQTLMSATTQLEVMADEDQPPCLVATPQAAQLIHDARDPLPFESAVVDDLDSFPSTSQGVSKARFQWSVSDASSNTFLALVEQTERLYVLPNRYLPADELRVRVDVFDRVARPTTCKPTDDVCGSSACLQRMTWTVRFR